MPKSTCSVGGCQRAAYARGWCRMHYTRWFRHGDPVITKTPARINGTIQERFYAKVDEADSDGCELWNSAMYPSGYGQFYTNGKYVGAHRVSYKLNVGPIPDGLELDHLCHTRDTRCPGGVTCKHRRCVNPAHLQPVTQAENNRRGRSVAAANAVKTHCDSGHPFNEENTYLYQVDANAEYADADTIKNAGGAANRRTKNGHHFDVMAVLPMPRVRLHEPVAVCRPWGGTR